MPILQAAGYNVPQAPSVSPAPDAGTPYQSSASATPDAFGGRSAAAVSRFSEQLDQASNHLLAVADRYNDVTADDMTNKAEDKINKIFYGDPDNPLDAGYNGLRGDAAMRAYPDVRKQIDQVFQQHRSALPTIAQQQRFDSQSRTFRNIMLSQVGRHYDQQFHQYQADESKANASLNIGKVAGAASDGDQAAFEAFVGKSLDDAQTRGSRMGLPPASIELEQQGVKQHAIKSWAEGLVARGDAIGADRFVENNRAAAGDLYEPLKRQFHAEAEKQQAYNDVFGPTMVRGGAVQNAVGDSVDHFLQLASKKESGDRNIMQQAVPAGGGYNPSTGTITGPSTAQGYYQITNSTWRDFAPAAGVNLSQYPNAMSAPQEVQHQVARQIVTTSGVQHWTPYNPRLKAAVEAAGLPTSGTIQAGPQTVSSAQQPAAAPITAVGDSLGAHLVRRGGAAGQESNKVGAYNPGDTAVAGWNPQQILTTVIPGIPDAKVKGQNVALSTGISNSKDAAAVQADLQQTVPQQIAALKARGASNVVVMGVGTDPKLAGANDALAKIAAANGATFAGPQRATGSDKIHSTNQPAEMAAVKAALGSPSAPAPITTPAPPPPLNASDRPDNDVPGLQAKLAQIDQRAHNEGWDAERYTRAYTLARTRLNAAYTDEQRQRQEQQRISADIVKGAENEVIADHWSGEPKMTAQQISVDHRFDTDPAARQRMLALIKPDRSGADPVTSANTMHDLMRQISSGEITDRAPILDAFNEQPSRLNEQHFNFLMKQVEDVRTPEGLKISKDIDKLIQAVKPSITKSNPMMGSFDESGDLQLGAFEEEVRNTVELMRKGGAKPRDIAEYLSVKRYRDNPELLLPYQTTAQESSANISRNLSRAPPPPPPGSQSSAPTMAPNPFQGGQEFYAPIPPPTPTPAEPTAAAKPSSAVQPRQPGESVQDYVKRAGIGLPK